MNLKLYQIIVRGRDPLFMAAQTSHRASLAFIVTELDADRSIPDYTVERIDQVPADQRVGLDDLLNHGTPGVVACDPVFGWSAIPSE